MDKYKSLMEGLAKLLLKSKLSNATWVGILDILKTDIILNSVCVIIDGKPLNNVD